MAVEQFFGAETVWHSDIKPAAVKLIERYWPGTNLGDITAIDWASVEPVDVMSGGSPCQDMSAAGKRAGMKSGTRSGLWSYMRDAIETIRPQFVLWENVRGAYSAAADSNMEPCAWCVGDGPDVSLRACGRVLGDLADLGYDAQWAGLRAADAGAPHGRFRVFILATDARQTDGAPRHGLGDGRQATIGSAPTDRPRNSDPASGVDWGVYEPAIRRWERILGRPAPQPTITGPKGGQQLSPELTDWMMGWPDGWTDVPGIKRAERLSMGGDGVVPQQAIEALHRLWPYASEIAA